MGLIDDEFQLMTAGVWLDATVLAEIRERLEATKGQYYSLDCPDGCYPQSYHDTRWLLDHVAALSTAAASPLQPIIDAARAMPEPLDTVKPALILNIMIVGTDSAWEFEFSNALPVPEVGDTVYIDYSESDDIDDVRSFRVLERSFWYGDDDLHLTLRVQAALTAAPGAGG